MVYGPSVGTGFHRKSRKRRRLRRLALPLLVFGPLLIWLVVKPFDGIPRARVNQPPAVVSSLGFPSLQGVPFRNSSEQIRRVVYPYSIIPGGVESAKELQNAVANDPVVAAHYQGFDHVKARVLRLNHARTVYVSYRRGNDVFWTSKRMRLAKGETVITDGEHTLRTRCGNQISEIPRAPVAPAATEPLSETLETPLFFGVTPPFEPPLVSPLVTEIQPTTPEGETGGIFIPPIVPIIVGGGGGTPFVPQPPPPVPEPATLVLLSTSLGAAWVVRKLRKN